MKQTLLIALLFCCNLAFGQLVVNEVSQGTNNKEYVELVVVGEPSCPNICVDVRGWILDDNNGWYATGSGTGIAAGHIRLADNPLWACITPGTIIVLYNDNDPNPLLPADDETDANSDCVYVIPYSSNVLERNASLPDVSSSAYSGPYVANGDWNDVILKKADDTYQTIDPTDLTQAYHAVSWGNNNSNNIIYMNYSAATEVYYMDNSVDDDPFNQNNWTQGIVGTNETPGVANNAANAAWISTLNVGCTLTTFADAGTDVTYCSDDDATTTLTASGGVSYEWSTTDMSASTIVNPSVTTTYTVTVTNASSCTNIDEVIIFINPTPTPSINQDGILCGNNSVILDAGAGYNIYNWSTSDMSQTTSVNTANTYTVTVTDSASCTATATTTVTDSTAPPNFAR